MLTRVALRIGPAAARHRVGHGRAIVMIRDYRDRRGKDCATLRASIAMLMAARRRRPASARRPSTGRAHCAPKPRPWCITTIAGTPVASHPSSSRGGPDPPNAETPGIDIDRDIGLYRQQQQQLKPHQQRDLFSFSHSVFLLQWLYQLHI